MILTTFRQLIMNLSSNITIKTMTGSTSQENGGNMLNNTRPFYVGIGTGNDAVTESDYKLSNALNISLTARSQSIGGNANKYTRFATVATTYTNNTGNAVTVKEIGIYVKYSTESSAIGFYLTRELLDTPVTIAPGESYTFTAVIDIK